MSLAAKMGWLPFFEGISHVKEVCFGFLIVNRSRYPLFFFALRAKIIGKSPSKTSVLQAKRCLSFHAQPLVESFSFFAKNRGLDLVTFSGIMVPCGGLIAANLQKRSD